VLGENDLAVLSQNCRPLQNLLQLPHISRPGPAIEHLFRFSTERDWQTRFRNSCHQVGCKFGDVSPAVS